MRKQFVKHTPASACAPCQKWLRRLGRRWRPAGRHSTHECAGQTVGWYAVVVCDCFCQQDAIAAITARDGWPTMALDSL